MPVYTYRREDGTTFDFRQKFLDDPLRVDPETGQRVTRVIQPAGVIFKGSGFYINDSKSASRSSITGSAKSERSESGEKSDGGEKSDKTEKSEKSEKAETKAEKSEKGEKSEKAEPKSAKPETTKAPVTAAAD